MYIYIYIYIHILRRDEIFQKKKNNKRTNKRGKGKKNFLKKGRGKGTSQKLFLDKMGIKKKSHTNENEGAEKGKGKKGGGGGYKKEMGKKNGFWGKNLKKTAQKM